MELALVLGSKADLPSTLASELRLQSLAPRQFFGIAVSPPFSM
jgi:hypothetical protein